MNNGDLVKFRSDCGSNGMNRKRDETGAIKKCMSFSFLR